jgi:hypothetical protein
LHKDKEARDWFKMPEEEMKAGFYHAFNLYVKNNKEMFLNLIEKFMPMHGYPYNWKEILWRN